MNTMRKLRCAVYTRKSSEEGLDQEFNSLDAQREACSAFIASQVGLGWKLVSDRYDDGGVSGGTMERPALLRLLDDIRLKRVDVVVVYKIDRLTRSLSDFARIVEVFDGNGVSFVSVTQQFNTTTSMGRLTLNVLLSFAQFEREVTAERIRDKIAASKAKGMWMGGTVPLGYEVIDRKLIVKEPEAGFVRALFSRYLELKSVPALAAEMIREAVLAEKETNGLPAAPAQSGIVTVPYTRRVRSGMLYKLLSNPLYIGRLKYRELVHDGEHQPLVDDHLFNAVQALLAANAVTPRGSRIHHSDHQLPSHLLTGLLHDDTGDRMSPTHAKAHCRRYRYYVSSRIKASKRTDPSSWRIPAPELDRTVVQFASRILADHGRLVDWIKANTPDTDIQASLDAARGLQAKLHGAANASTIPLDQGRLEGPQQLARSDCPWPRVPVGKTIADLSQAQPCVMSSFDEIRGIVTEMFSRITLGTEAITFLVDVQGVIGLLKGSGARASRLSNDDRDEHPVALQLPITVKRRGNEMRLIIEGDHMTRAPDPSLVTLVAKAHVYLEQLTSAPGISVTDVANTHSVHRADVGRLLPLAFLAPKLLHQILSGSQPLELSARFMARTELPHLWTKQIAAFS